MKTSYPKTSWLCRHPGGVASASALLLLGFAATGQVIPKSPVGTWDCVMSGAREGLAIITFLGDGTFTNHEILVPKPPRTAVVISSDQRNGSGDTGRTLGTSSTTTSGLPAHTEIYGGERTGGPWGFDSRRRVVGYFYEISQPIYTTNSQQLSSATFTNSVNSDLTTNYSFEGREFCIDQPVGTITNGDSSLSYVIQETCYTNIVGATAVTNAISFVGTVVPGRRLTLLASTPAGRVNFTGVPDLPLTDISGSWYGSKHVGHLWYNEFFTVTRVSPDANVYMVEGGGPTYIYSGMAFLCPQRKIAIALGVYPVFPVGADQNPVPPVVRAVVGSFNSRNFSGALHGLEGAQLSTAERFNFAIQRQ